ncbi:hypothetical protein Sste5346_002015 [Sporothrix stenoceras]|uniref:(S)-ureidoglycine aminohydrolase cupin domain-containing protein n=1 Tax=Sporothrix stenoceras TaxID=5173 RepID=A0ABR3ZKN2_9PEZI
MSEVIVPTEPIKYAAASMPLPSMPYAADQIVSGSPDATSVTIWAPSSQTITRSGIWDCTPGAANYQQEPTEISIFSFFSGKAWIRFPNKEKDDIECVAGDVIYLPQGILTVFDVVETIRTFYVVHA